MKRCKNCLIASQKDSSYIFSCLPLLVTQKHIADKLNCLFVISWKCLICYRYMSHSKYLETLLYITGEDDYEGLGGISIHTP